MQKDTLTQSNLGINGEVINSGIGIKWPRLFDAGNPYDAIKWEKRTAKITKSDGTVVFEQNDVEVPSFWTQTATDIVASKYFRGKLNSPERECGVKQMVDRVAKTIGEWGIKDGYFNTIGDCDNFVKDLTWLLVNQYAAFNSPVWFNVGVYEKPQASACYILAVEDNMQSILDWFRDEGWIFKYGSGSGINLSKLRSSKEPLSRGGYSSGPVSFMKGADGVANSIRSGGTTRRAAKMVVLNADHPDIHSFIYSKKIIEDMTKALAREGFKDSIAADLFDPYTLLPYQNANNSVRVTDAFMRAVEADGYWDLKSVTTGEIMETVKAKDALRWMADAAWHSADPGIQYDTTINEWHTIPNAGRINASNPCSEYMSIDNSACNLASLNLMKFLREGGRFDVDTFKKTVDTMILAQDILVDRASYPTEKITANARAYRQLGLGYANLGSLLMILGLPYDSDEGRILASHITSLMCGEAYRMSAVIASYKGPFAGYLNDKDGMLSVLSKHLNAAESLFENSPQKNADDKYLETASRLIWHEVKELTNEYGVRNSQVTVLAPTGTISFLMDCDTTGIEPELALVKYKKLVGGGTFKLVNNQVPIALRRLGYLNEEVDAISSHILERETIEGAPYLKEEHLSIFDCSFKAPNGTRSINYMGHIKMMAAAQSFISGAISKTINLPSDATVEDIEDVFFQGWRLGLKALAVYRDGCKSIQPLNTSSSDKRQETSDKELVEKINGYTRIKLPDERPSITHKFSVGGFESYLTVGFYPDTMQPGETFITTAKEGSTISGLFDTMATLTSMCLQSGIPLKTLVKKFKDMRFEPAGFTSNPNIPIAKSVIDYVFRYLGLKYLSPEDREEIFGPEHIHVESVSVEQNEEAPQNDKFLAELVSSSTIRTEKILTQVHGGNGKAKSFNADAPLCNGCGTIMIRAGSCYSCPNCFATTGVCN
ncbi:MAG: ribonucleoside-diphosphate reductase, adenosylcobalamin-dependent [Candidatus Yanofskybacteria bacterium RIFCSPHIGHO2_02_FULL_43_22]|uniref:Vitamin B12-dependent ribonucleotide reductase n=1 Tax=Candidatus Yanofskybacteria bacterium RIFCSPHIGHO2_02_FULL_43_22 TaxID=1802681 RepID=A0A1F8FKQ7_9BACT|nr:MAG: ribonucleoside-diphosphate reductase, adenosylcobalamin-dependent [Candidatus Yanofskybacteria bacterium RIFCSPHIGHO2_02_FULL_43_22]